MELCSVFENIENCLWSENQTPVFLSFCFWAITLLLTILLINVAYFLMRFFWRIKQSNQASLNFLSFWDPKKDKNHLIFFFSFYLTDRCNRKIIPPWLTHIHLKWHFWGLNWFLIFFNFWGKYATLINRIIT